MIHYLVKQFVILTKKQNLKLYLAPMQKYFLMETQFTPNVITYKSRYQNAENWDIFHT